MLTIRRVQIEALRQGRVADFERRVLLHLAEHFPKHMRALTEEQALVIVRYAVERGAERGVDTERDVCKLANLMTAFGPDLLDREVWARESWEAPAATPSARVNRLYDRALDEARRRAT